MEQTTEQNHEAAEECRLSNLNDDLLLSILDKVNVVATVRASVLSKRWQNLPWMLPQLNIDAVKDFLGDASSDAVDAKQIDRTMVSLRKAIRSLLAVPRRKCILTKLKLGFFLTSKYSSDIGRLVSDAIDNGILKDLELASGFEKSPDECSNKEMLQHAQSVNIFFSAYPSVTSCLTKLTLYNATFVDSDMHNLLMNVCKQLRHLILEHCDAGYRSVFKMDGPNSKLNVLELHTCCFEKVEVVCLPKLEYLHCDSWASYNAPLSLGFVPCLKELHLFCAAMDIQNRFKLTGILHGTTGVHTLTLNFQGEMIWLQPEGKQLCNAFNKLRKLSLHGVDIKFGLLWTRALIEAASSLEILDIEVWDHPCEANDASRLLVHSKKSNASWKSAEFSDFQHCPLRELHICGFIKEEKQMAFIRYVMGRALNLERVVLIEEEECEDCAMISIPACQVECRFPKDKDEQDKVIDQLKDGTSSHVQIVFK